MNKEPENTITTLKENSISLAFLLLFLGFMYVWGSDILLIYKLILSALIIFLFYYPILFPLFGFTEGSLNKKIAEERKRMCAGKYSGWQWFDLSRIYHPSPFSVIVIIILGLMINLPTFYFPWFQSFLKIDQIDKVGYFNNLIAIHAGIGAIIFALLIFVAESLRDDSKERASVLLKESLLFPLTLLEIITFLAFIKFSDQSSLVAIPIFIVGCFAIYSLYNLMRILLSPFEFQKKRLSLLTDRVKKSISEAINERIGSNILHKFLDSDQVALNSNYFSKKDKKGYTLFKINEIGIVKDINMDILLKVAEHVETQANSKGFSFFEKKPKTPTSSSQDAGLLLEVEYYTTLQSWEAALTKFYHDRLEPESNVVLVISKKITGEDKIFEEEINKLIHKLFIVGKENNFSEEIKLELEALRDQFVEAVQQIKITKIDYFKNVYLSLSETFLDLINQCGGGFTPEQAKNEGSFFSNGWSEIGWLDDHLRDIFLVSIKTANEEMIRKIAFIPIAIAISGIRKNDHFIFQKFIKYANALHYEALEPELESHSSLKKDMIKHSIAWLKEISDYYIESDLEEDPTKIQFAFRILLEFQVILKRSFEKNNFESFEQALDTFSRLLKRFEPSKEYPNAEHLTWELNNANDAKKREEIKEKLDIQKTLEEAEKEYNIKKQQLLFGLTSWIFKIITKSSHDPQNKKQFFEKLKMLQPKKPEDLTSVFVSTHDHDVQNYFGWDWWDMIPDGGVRIMDFGKDIEYLYILLMLESLVDKSQEEILAMKLPSSRDLAFLAESSSSLYTKLDNINTIPNLDSYISVQAKEKVDSLRSLLVKAKKDQEDKEKLEIMSRSLDEKKVEEFKKSFIKEFYNHVSLRPMFKIQGKLLDKTQGIDINPESLNLWGYNQIESKEAFFENWHVHYPGWGEQYGEGFARSEDTLIYKEISEKLLEKQHISFFDFIPSMENFLRKNNYSKPYIFSSFAHSMEIRALKSSEKFIPRWDSTKNHKGLDKFSFYIGYLDFKIVQIPIFGVVGFSRENIRNACLVDMDTIGILKQYPPIKVKEDKEFQKDIFMFKVIDLNLDEEQRLKIINQKPEWLKDKPDPDSYLKTKVLLNMYSKVEFIVTDINAGVYFTFKEKEELY